MQQCLDKDYCYTNELVFDYSELDINNPVLNNPVHVVETTVDGISFGNDDVPFIGAIEIAELEEQGS